MKVENVLNAKGRKVETVSPQEGVAGAIQRLISEVIGALVVSSDGQRVEGVFSERDVVRGLAKHGSRLMDMRVGEVMTRSAPVCSSQDSLAHVMSEMTRTRHRHLPVVDDGRLTGMLSIGDVVKHRLEEMALETSVLRDAYRASR